MKKITLSVLAALCYLSATAQTQSLKTRQLKGKVKSVIEHSWMVDNDKSGDTTTYVCNFNEAGYLTDETATHQNGKKSFDKYDDKGNILESTGENGDKEIYHYNLKGNLAEKDDNDSEYGGKLTYLYDANDSLTEVDHYNLKSILDARSVYTFDASKKKIEYVYYDSGVIASQEQYKYNDKGIISETDTYTKDSLTGKIYYKYNKAGQQVSSLEYDSAGKVIDTDSTMYDDHGFTIFSKDINPDMGDEPLIRYSSYDYDEKGNWIHRKDYEVLSGKKSLSMEAVQKIIYY